MANTRVIRWTMAAEVAAMAVLLVRVPAAAPLPQEDDQGFQGGRMYSLPRDEDLQFLVEDAKKEIRAGRFGLALTKLQTIIGARTGGPVVVETRMQLYTGLRSSALEVLRAMPAEALLAYDRMAEEEEGLPTARVDRSVDRNQLQRLALRFPVSSQGRKARRILGDIALERAEVTDALAHFRRLQETFTGPDPETENRIALCRFLLGGLRAARQGATTDEAKGVVDGHGRTALEFLGNELARAKPLPPRRSVWASFGGGGDGTQPMDEVAPGAELQWTHPYDEALPIGDRPANGSVIHAVGDGERVYLCTGNEAVAYNLLTGETAWRVPGPLVGEYENKKSFMSGVNPNAIYAGALSKDLFVCAFLVPELTDIAPTMHRFHNIPIMTQLPVRRLFAIDARTGKRVWAHWGEGEDALRSMLSSAIDVCGTPLIQGDRVYVATHNQTGTIALYLSAFELATGRLAFRTLLCSSQQEVNMFGNAVVEYVASPLAIHEGIVYGSSNLGLCYAVDGDTGEIRWLAGYDQIPSSRSHQFAVETRSSTWFNNPPVVLDGVVAMTPLDCETALGLDASTGDRLWTLSYQPPVPGTPRNGKLTTLTGALGGKFIFSGNSVVAIRPRPARTSTMNAELEPIRNATELGQPYGDRPFSIPRPAIDGTLVYYLASAGMRVFDGKGIAAESPMPSSDPATGNLFLQRGVLLTTSNERIQAYFSMDSLKQNARELVRKNPSDAAARCFLADLLRNQKHKSTLDTDEAFREYQRALELAREQGLPEDGMDVTRIRAGLFEIAMRRALDSERQTSRNPVKEYRNARQVAPDADAWMRAELRVLDLLADRPGELRAELAELERNVPDAVHSFPDLGRMRVGLYAALRLARSLAPPSSARAAASSPRTAETADPEAAVRVYQRILERYGSDRVEGKEARVVAREEIAKLVGKHGRRVYAAFDEEAAAALRAAGSDASLLRSIPERYPNSLAAEESLRSLADEAARRGDFAGLVTVLRTGSAGAGLQPGLLRRIAVCAEKRGNTVLARALIEKLQAEHGSEPSDYAGDGGKTYGELARELPVPAARAARSAAPPTEKLSEKPCDPESVMPLELHDQPGFYRKGDLPLLLVREEKIEAYELDPARPVLGRPLYQVACPLLFGLPAFVFGDLLVVAELQTIKAFSLLDGSPKWTLAQDPMDEIALMVVRNGLLLVWSAQAGGGAQELSAVEPMSGTRLWSMSPGDLPIGTVPRFAERIATIYDAQTSGKRILLVDLLTGKELRPIVLDRGLPAAIGLKDDLQPSAIQRKTMLATADHVVFAYGLGTAWQARVVALDLGTGKVAWHWKALSGHEVKNVVLHRSGILVLQSSPRDDGELAFLDPATGRPNRPAIKLKLSPRILSLDPYEQMIYRQDLMLILDHHQAAAPAGNVTLVDLTNEGATWAYPLGAGTGKEDTGSPVLNDRFVAFALTRNASNRQQILLHVLDRSTSRSLLPDGIPSLPLNFDRPYQLVQVGGLLVVQTRTSTLIFGPRT